MCAPTSVVENCCAQHNAKNYHSNQQQQQQQQQTSMRYQATATEVIQNFLRILPEPLVVVIMPILLLLSSSLVACLVATTGIAATNRAIAATASTSDGTGCSPFLSWIAAAAIMISCGCYSLFLLYHHHHHHHHHHGSQKQQPQQQQQRICCDGDNVSNNNDNNNNNNNTNNYTIAVKNKQIVLLEEKLAEALQENERLIQKLTDKDAIIEEYTLQRQQQQQEQHQIQQQQQQQQQQIQHQQQRTTLQQRDEGDDTDNDVEDGKRRQTTTTTTTIPRERRNGTTTTAKDKDDNSNGSSSNGNNNTTTTFDVPNTIEEIQRFLFLDGRHISDCKTMVATYVDKLLEFDIPLDRLFIGGFGKHATAMAYNWKWEKSNPDFVLERKVPKSVLEKLSNSNEPFALMLHGKTKRVRILPGQGIPYDSKWYEDGNYQDYLALEMTYKNKYFGGVAWATKRPGGFTDDHLKVLEALQNELSTVIAHHVHELANHHLTKILEETVQDRTKKLALTNKSLEDVNRRVILQSKAQLRHFAMMSHEIRTPLNCIVGMSNLLLGSPKLDEELDDSVRMIVESGDLLSAVVNDVLDYSRLESGNVDVEESQIDLLQNLSTVVDTIRCKGNERNVRVNTHFAMDLPKYILSDGRRLQQILYNLMGNAIKFSNPNADIDLTVSIVATATATTATGGSNSGSRAEEEGTIIPAPLSSPSTTTTASGGEEFEYQTLCFSVKDYGRGIRKEDLEKIFEPFVQASTDTQRFYGGTGLGLAITSKLVKGLGGTIRADSEFGCWSEFVVELCVKKSKVAIHNGTDNGETDAITSTATTMTTTTASARTTSLPAGQGSSEVTTTTADSKKKKNKQSPDCKDDCKVAKQTQQPKDLGRLKVLIAEDNLVNQKVLDRTLQRLGLKHITIVDNGKKAVDAASESAFDVIFMDMQMPVMDGLEATRQIVQMTKKPQQKQHPTPPKIVFVTAHALANFQAEAEAAGGSGFISKPFNLKKIETMFQALDSAGTNHGMTKL